MSVVVFFCFLAPRGPFVGEPASQDTFGGYALGSLAIGRRSGKLF
jgi:hypothetical protein